MKTRTMILVDLFASLRLALDVEEAAVLLWAIMKAAEKEGDAAVYDCAGRAMAALEHVQLAGVYLEQLIVAARRCADEAHSATERMLALTAKSKAVS